MRQYYKLIKNRTISFGPLLIDKYHLLGLNEVDVIILIKLHQQLIQGKKKLSAKDLISTMSISLPTLSKKIVELVDNGFITLAISKTTQQEEFSLAETYKKLGALLEEADTVVVDEGQMNDIKKVVSSLEEKMKRVLSPVDLDIVRHWLKEDKFSYEAIEAAIFECVKIQKLDVKYIDVILNKTKTKAPSKPKEDLRTLFNSVYDKE